MGSGRCGATSLLSYLNKKPQFNIYGENNGIIYNILDAIHRTNMLKIKQQMCRKYSSVSYDNNTPYISVEWYNPEDKVKSLDLILLDIVVNYFESEYNYIGFKEVRWLDRDLRCLNILENKYNVKYVFLTRNIQDQIKSIQKLNWNLQIPIDDYIRKTDGSIIKFLNTKPKNQFITKNISVDKNFLAEIYEFIVGDTQKIKSAY
jgi:hypothetical protein